ncbi:MAG TPA: hypothetical protein VFV05_01220 [Methylomirabilota bacterium]|nr:hypothetical protein [Methylomirabilota bacterium]
MFQLLTQEREAAGGFIGKFDARMSSLSVEMEQASTMKHDVTSQTVDDAVIAVNDLADRLVYQAQARHIQSEDRP